MSDLVLFYVLVFFKTNKPMTNDIAFNKSEENRVLF